MSNFSLSDNDLVSNIPSLPNFGDSLKFIQTKKYLPIISQSLFQKNIKESQVQLNNENSLQLQINNQQVKSLADCTEPGSTPYKKKRAGCICKKTQCLKMYCQCFASGKMCTSDCVCHGCNNNEKHQDLIQRAKQSIKLKNQQISKKQIQSKGCNCKKSQCQKKYCQCFNAGLACNQMCKCQECANMEGYCTHKSIKEENENEQSQQFEKQQKQKIE